MQVFHIPPAHEAWVLVLPAILVAKADGTMGTEEVFEILWSSYCTAHLEPESEQEEHAFERYVLDNVRRAISLDAVLVSRAVNAWLKRLQPAQANTQRRWIRRLCERVARAEGQSWFKRVSDEERQMLDALFNGLEVD